MKLTIFIHKLYGQIPDGIGAAKVVFSQEDGTIITTKEGKITGATYIFSMEGLKEISITGSCTGICDYDYIWEEE